MQYTNIDEGKWVVLFCVRFFKQISMEGDYMATKSITKNVDIKDKKLCKAFVSALENAEKKHSKEVSLSRSFIELKGEKIKELFGDSK